MKILKIKYQRNGVSGNPFHTCLFEAPEYSKEFQNCDKVFLATFQSKGSDVNDRINISTVRVENLSRLDLDWRGDKIGWALQEAIDKYCDRLKVPRTLVDASFPKYTIKKIKP